MENNRSLDDAWLQMPRATYPQPALLLEYRSLFSWVSLAVAIAIWMQQVCHKRGNALVAAPVMGSKIPYYRRLQFLTDAKTPVQEGYDKV